jgi:uncharacterized protein YceH (UPF0502 family)
LPRAAAPKESSDLSQRVSALEEQVLTLRAEIEALKAPREHN